MNIKVIFVDDHPIVLNGLKEAVAQTPGISVMGIARSATELIKMLETIGCDVAVVDYVMPSEGSKQQDGMLMFEYLLEHYPLVHWVVFTMLENIPLLRSLRKLGISSIVSKRDDVANIASAIMTAYFSGHYYTDHLRDKIIMAPNRAEDRELGRKEIEVLRYYVSGFTVSDIASILGRNVKTISTQKNMALKKLGIIKEADLYQYAIAQGLLNSGEPNFKRGEQGDALEEGKKSE